MPGKQSEAGRKGYLAALFSTGGEFHRLGGRETARLYYYTNPQTGAVGYEAAVRDGYHQPQGKRHRYSQEQEPLASEIEKYENRSWRYDLEDLED
jgi:hypothetical protein